MKCKPNLTIDSKYGIFHDMENMRKSYYKKYTSVCPTTLLDWHRYKILETHKARCREKIDFHKKNIILQSILSFMCLMGAFYTAQKKSISAPLILTLTGAASCYMLAKHETKRKRYKEILDSLEKE